MESIRVVPRAMPVLALLLSFLAACGSAADEASPREPAPVHPMVGRSLAGVELEAIGEAVPLSGDGAARATLVRWWTDRCPFCVSSLPAIEELRERYGPQGLATVAVYHPKPPAARVDPDEVRRLAAERGYAGSLAADPAWNHLREHWPSEQRDYTSVSLLLDAGGTVRWAHGGPEYFPADQREDEGPNRDFEALEGAIRGLLGG